MNSSSRSPRVNIPGSLPGLPSDSREAGIVLIFLVWLLAAAAVMAATVAGEIRLAALAVHHQSKQAAIDRDLHAAASMAMLELMISRMPEPPGADAATPMSARRRPGLRFDGQPLALAYPAPVGITVRIHDQAGKINLARLTPDNMRALLEKKIGRDEGLTSQLIDAWQDWLDTDDLKRLHGAEKEEYRRLGLAYSPRNGPLETVDELLLIPGFADFFKDVELDLVFTLHGRHNGVNPNLANFETLRLLPGLDEAATTAIIELRRQQEIRSPQDMAFIIDPAQAALATPWLHFSTSNHYTIAVHPATEDETGNAHLITVEAVNATTMPRILQVNPFGRLPRENSGDE